MEDTSVRQIVLMLFTAEPVAFGAVSLYTVKVAKFDYPTNFTITIVTISVVYPAI